MTFRLKHFPCFYWTGPRVFTNHSCEFAPSFLINAFFCLGFGTKGSGPWEVESLVLQSLSSGAAHYWSIQTVPKQTLSFMIHCATSLLARQAYSWHTHLCRGVESRAEPSHCASCEGIGGRAGPRGWRLCWKPRSCWNVFHIKEDGAEGGIDQARWRSHTLLIPSLATAGERPQMVSRQTGRTWSTQPSDRWGHHDMRWDITTCCPKCSGSLFPMKFSAGQNYSAVALSIYQRWRRF